MDTSGQSGTTPSKRIPPVPPAPPRHDEPMVARVAAAPPTDLARDSSRELPSTTASSQCKRPFSAVDENESPNRVYRCLVHDMIVRQNVLGLGRDTDAATAGLVAEIRNVELQSRRDSPSVNGRLASAIVETKIRWERNIRMLEDHLLNSFAMFTSRSSRINVTIYVTRTGMM